MPRRLAADRPVTPPRTLGRARQVVAHLHAPPGHGPVLSVDFRLMSGGTVTFNSISLAPNAFPGLAMSVSFTRTRMVGSPVTQMVMLNAGMMTMMNYGLNGFTNLTSLRLTPSAPDFAVQFDNVAFTNVTQGVVPQPSTYALMGTGLVGLLTIARSTSTREHDCTHPSTSRGASRRLGRWPAGRPAADISTYRRWEGMPGTGTGHPTAPHATRLREPTTGNGLTPRGASFAVVSGNDVTLDFANELDVLNYAFALEQLEAAFYTQVVANGAFGSIFSAGERTVLTDLRDHEIVHREFFRTALSGAAIPDLSVDFSSIGFASRDSVLATAEASEDLGVGACNGAGRHLRSAVYLTLAGKIHSVEARHASEIRRLRGEFADTEPIYRGWITGDQTYVPGAEAVYAGEENTNQGGVEFTTLASIAMIDVTEKTESFDEPLTQAQVLAITDPFIA